MANNADPDQLASTERQDISGFSRTRVKNGTDLDKNLQKMTEQALEDSMDSFTIHIHTDSSS